jgi:hypothetical protein
MPLPGRDRCPAKSADSTATTYGPLGEQFIEADHIVPLAQAEVTTTIAFSMLVGARSETQIIGDGSEPFRTTAIIAKPGYSPEFWRYSALYVGGLASPNTHTGVYVRVNPKEYR